MRRLYFLLPSVDSATHVVNDLTASGIEKDHIHVIANKSIPLQDLPEAGTAEKSDLIPSVQRGLAVGGASGLLAGLMAVALPVGVLAGGAIVLGATAAGAGIGAWASSMIGISTPNPEIAQFEEAIKQGQLLMLVDVPEERISEIKSLVSRHHPEARIYETAAARVG
jgi:anti-sigma factor RsiW